MYFSNKTWTSVSCWLVRCHLHFLVHFLSSCPANQKRRRILDVSSVTTTFCIYMVISTFIYFTKKKNMYIENTAERLILSKTFLVWMTKCIALDNWEWCPPAHGWCSMFLLNIFVISLWSHSSWVLIFWTMCVVQKACYNDKLIISFWETTFNL